MDVLCGWCVYRLCFSGDFPELGHAQEAIEHSEVPLIAYVENHVYILSLLGLLVFYGLDIWALKSRQHNRNRNDQDRTQHSVFWIHIAAFAVLNIIVGYLLQELSAHTLARCFLFFGAMALHFFIVDHGLREHRQAPCNRHGRWLLTMAIIVGAIAGQSIHLSEAGVLVVWSFLAGSIILLSGKNYLMRTKVVSSRFSIITQHQCEHAPAQYDDLKALLLNCTLNRTPVLSHTRGVINIVKEIFEANGLQPKVIRPVDYKMPAGLGLDMSEMPEWDKDDWPQLQKQTSGY